MEEFNCTACNRNFSDEKALKQHTKHKHKHESDTELIQTKTSTGFGMKFALLIGGGILVFAVFAFIFYPSLFNSSTPPTGNVVQTSDTQFSQNQEVKEFSMIAKKWQFDPATITVNQGDRVKLLITSIDVAHGIGLPSFGINQRLSPGQTTIIEFVADKKGTFPFSCSVSCGIGHRTMTGAIIVN